ncbi:hypothetical protein [uncultured Corynebacterium sp.]|uniref:hypothetical protein n=1 Tax=uncultured Corynebacterium sp. TaxID=159447 RepID=UPI0025F8FF94|nr:hypothetical protein [uncultured Corynebacterium sp.]
MNRPIRATACLLLAGLALPCLSACSTVVDFFGPRPDPVLVQLAAQAEASGSTAHADALWAEVARLCGTKADGQVPHSCEVDHTAAVAALDATPAPEPLTAAVPAESRALIISQAIDDAVAASTDAADPAADPVTDPAAEHAAEARLPVAQKGDTLAGTDAEQATELLSWEHGVLWALNFAHAYADSDTAARIDAAIDEHENIARQLTAVLTDPPVEAAGYTAIADSPDAPALPTDTASAAAFANALLDRTGEYWAAVTMGTPLPAGASESGTPVTPWLSYLIATSAQLRAA